MAEQRAKKIGPRTTRYEILDALCADGYSLDNPLDALDVATTIQLAARRGCLVWTSNHVVSTLTSRPLHLRK